MSRLKKILLVSSILFLVPAYAADKPKSIEKQTLADRYLSANEAHNLKQQQGSKVLFVDVRTPSELVFVGSPKGMDANIPLVRINYKHWDKIKSSFSKTPNLQFVSAFNNLISAKNLTKDTSIILLCRSGKRSAKAANLLTSAGYSNVYSVINGFEGDKAKLGNEKGKRVVNGWKNAGLPWSYKLERNRLSLK